MRSDGQMRGDISSTVIQVGISLFDEDPSERGKKLFLRKIQVKRKSCQVKMRRQLKVKFKYTFYVVQ